MGRRILSGFDGLTKEELDTHLRIRKYGNFTLTGAVFPPYDSSMVPKTGMRYGTYRYCKNHAAKDIPVVTISATKEYLFELFMEMADLFPDTVDVFLESFHNIRNSCPEAGYFDFLSENMDRTVLESVLWDFEEPLLEDGMAGICVLNRATQTELQFDDHKLLFLYNWGMIMDRLLEIFKKYGITEDPLMKFFTDVEHIHQSSDELEAKFEELKRRIGADSRPS